MLEAIAYNYRHGSNQIAAQVKLDAEKQLGTHDSYHGTCYDKFKYAVKGVSIDFSNLGNSSFPSDSKSVLLYQISNTHSCDN